MYMEARSQSFSIPAFWGNLFMSLVVAVAAGGVGAVFHAAVLPFYMLLIVAELALIVTIQLLRKKKNVSYAICYAFVIVSGFITGAVVAADPTYASVAGVSAVETLIIFGVLSAIAIRTKRLFLGWGTTLTAILFALVIVELLAIFILGITAVTWLVLSAIGVVLFSGFILYDIQRACNKGYGDTVPLLVVSVYLDILNLFMNLLNINSFFSRR